MRDDTALNNFLDALPGWLIELRRMQDADARAKEQLDLLRENARIDELLASLKTVGTGYEPVYESGKLTGLKHVGKSVQEQQLEQAEQHHRQTLAATFASNTGYVPEISEDGTITVPEEPTFKIPGVQVVERERNTPAGKLNDYLANKKLDLFTTQKEINNMVPQESLAGLSDQITKLHRDQAVDSYIIPNYVVNNMRNAVKLQTKSWATLTYEGKFSGEERRIWQTRRSLLKLLDEIERNNKMLEKQIAAAQAGGANSK